MEKTIFWQCKTFNQLSSVELYGILQLRSEIFVVEQNCIYQDMDGLDQQSHHLTAVRDEKIIAYSRLLPPMFPLRGQAIGRVVVKQNARSCGIGRALMKQSIEKSYELFGKNDITIGAQLYLKKFYESFGFKQSGDGYDEDGIPHIKMIIEIEYPIYFFSS
jgi:ElaA protein